MTRKEKKYKPLKRKVDLTDMQREVYNFIESYRIKNDEGPTFREVAEAVGRPGTKIGSTLDGMRRRGLITWGPRAARSLDIVRRCKHKTQTSKPSDVINDIPEVKEAVHSNLHLLPGRSAEGPNAPSLEYVKTCEYIDARIRRLRLELKSMEDVKKYLDQAGSTEHPANTSV